ncbi:MAG: hypothetical protein DRI61_10445 [Chloroflexi bacterium]|nr:MAG: hypothetical protein DRI61_10445 [Chloroflexota bacterium]
MLRGKSSTLIRSSLVSLVFLLSLAVYFLTLAPTITWAHNGADGGDLITAVVTGGVPHPHGYPTYLLLGELFICIPWGDFAWRLNLMSAVCAAIAAALIALAVYEIKGLRLFPKDEAYLPALGASLALAFSPLLWSQAVISEVYAPALAFTAAIITCALPILCRASRTSLGLLLLGFLYALGLGAHLTLLFLAPIVGLALWRTGRKGAISFGAGFAVGLAVFAILPLRAGGDSPVNWGAANTWKGFWWLVSGKLYHRYVFAVPLRFWPQRILAWGNLMVRQFTPVGALLVIIGVEGLWRRDQTFSLALLLSVIGLSIYAIGYNTTDSYVYLTFSLPLLALFLGAGLGKVRDGLRVRFLGQMGLALFILLCVALPGAELLSNWNAADLHTDWEAWLFGKRTLAEAPVNAVLVTDRDEHTFTLWYFRYALRLREDVVVVDRDLLRYNWYREALARQPGMDFLRGEDVSLNPEQWGNFLQGRPIIPIR